MKCEKGVLGSELRSTSGVNPVILSGSCTKFTPSEMRHQRNAYNDNHIEIAGLSIDTISRTSKYLNTILTAEMVLNGTRYFGHRSLAHLTDPLTWDGRLGGGNVVRRTNLKLLVCDREIRNAHDTSSSALPARVNPKNSADAPCGFLSVNELGRVELGIVKDCDGAV
jgi:hypothetical protein